MIGKYIIACVVSRFVPYSGNSEYFRFHSSVDFREDPENDYEYYDLTKDTDGLLENTTYSRSDCFGKVKCWKRKAE
jgi:hypothetical protein